MSDNYLFSVILMGLILLGASFFVIEPLMRVRLGNMFEDQFEESPIHHLLARKDSIYTAMKDLEFDFTTGKLSEDDYQALTDKFAAEAAKVLESIEVMEGKAPSQDKEAAKEAVTEKCSDCGFALKPEDKFCQSCGTAVA